MQKSSQAKGRAAQGRFQLLIAFGGAAAGMALAIISMRMESSIITLAMAVAGFMISVISLQASHRWWRQADEAVKEAHKSGWYWGGSTGLAIAGGIAAVLYSLEPDISLRQFALFAGDAGLMATGLVVAVGLAFIGYAIAWAAWWMRNR